MKTCILIFTISVLIASQAFAAPGDPGTFNQGQIIQGFAPNGTLAAALTVNSATYDMSLYAAFSVYAPIDGKIRFMATSSKAGSVQEPVLGGQWNTFIVNKATPFVNLSSLVGGFLRRQ